MEANDASARSFFDAAGQDMALVLWGKARPGEGARSPAHPLLFHMLDVTSVAALLLDERMPRSTTERLLGAIEGPRDSARAWILFFVALHDLGKASPAFQQKWAPAIPALRALGFDIAPPRDVDHATLGAALLVKELEARGVTHALAKPLARAVAAHHGGFPTDVQTQERNFSSDEKGRALVWSASRRSIVDRLATTLGVASSSPAPRLARERDWGFFSALAGLTAVADWIGSIETVFRYELPDVSLDEYARRSRERAREALAMVGFRAPAPQTSRTFFDLFGFAPRPLQTSTSKLLASVRAPFCCVVEAPMGEGKTEAALSIAAELGARGEHDGTYFALPTQATANQMFDRLAKFLETTRPGEIVNLQLVHGEAGFSERVRRLLAAVYEDASGEGGLRCERWFLGKKRTLLAPFGAGTIDQALLSVMQTKHAFVRQLGLAGKTVIFDEVHAYDTYTGTLLDRLVAWLGALGATVVILSATLPSSRRKSLLEAYAGRALGDEVEGARYPRISWASAEVAGVESIAAERASIEVQLAWDEDDEDACIERVREQIAEGGGLGIIRNSVRRAQATFRRLLDLEARGALPQGTELLLLHARFPGEERIALEQRLMGKLGRDGARPARMIVVGTQVLEQSLDVDFDLLITDVAPVDLLLQRAGRLHRHGGRKRPRGAEKPLVRVVIPKGDPAACDLRSIAGVYEPFFHLRRSLLLLRGRDRVTLPNEIEPLVEAVYDEATEPLSGKLAEECDAFESKRSKHEGIAKTRAWPSPMQRNDPFTAMHDWLEEEDPSVREALRAETRLGEDSIEVVCLFGNEEEAYFDRSKRERVDLRTPLDGALGRDVVRRLARRTVRVNQKGLVQAIRASGVPAAWKEVSILERRRPLFFDTPVPVDRFMLELDPELGLVIKTT